MKQRELDKLGISRTERELKILFEQARTAGRHALGQEALVKLRFRGEFFLLIVSRQQLPLVLIIQYSINSSCQIE